VTEKNQQLKLHWLFTRASCGNQHECVYTVTWVSTQRGPLPGTFSTRP